MIIALVVTLGTPLGNPVFAQTNPFTGGGGFQQNYPGASNFGNSIFPGGNSFGYNNNFGNNFNNSYASPFSMNPAANMGWLGGQNLYSQPGGPVAGAEAYQNLYAQQAGSGINMLNQCSYPQAQIVDPVNSSPEVTDAKEALRDAIDASKAAKEVMNDASKRLEEVKEKLKGDLADGTSADEMLDIAKNCDKFNTSQKVTDFLSKSDNTLPPFHGTWGDLFKDDEGLNTGKAKAACWAASTHRFATRTANWDPQKLCLTVHLKPDRSDETKNAKDMLFEGGPTAVSGPGKNCSGHLTEAWEEQKKYDDAKRRVEEAEKLKAERDKGIEAARRAVRKQREADARESAKEAKYDQDAGIPANIQGCEGCIIMYQQQQAQNQGINKTALGITAGVVGGGIGLLSILSGYSIARHNQGLGFLSNPLTSSGTAIWGNGISNGLQAGLPFLMSGRYGETPGGGYTRGGYGCAPTMNGSQMGWGQGPFNTPWYNGAYYPGAAYMPGAGNWGVNGYPGAPGLFPGAPGYPGGPGGNMFMQQQQMMQQMQLAQMNQQLQNSWRAQQGAMMAMQYGLNNANTQFAVAQSYLAQNSYAGSFAGGGAGGYYQQPPPLANYLNGSFMGGYAQNLGCNVGGASLSICFGGNLGGGSYYPTYSNSNYGNQFQYPQFNNPQINAGGYIR